MADKPTVRDHRGETTPKKRVPPPQTGIREDAIIRDHRHTGIEHIFVLMLENRSFDHMLGFSGITGTDAVTGKPTSINGLKGTESNTFNGKKFTVQKGAPNVMPHDPGHEFEDVLTQLAGEGAKYAKGGKYPKITSSGYVAAYAKGGGQDDPSLVMKCYTPSQLPVLTALAREFVVCDNWYASMPGPTWPNRMFTHAGTGGGLDHSPSTSEIVEWELAPGGGFEFPKGSMYAAFDRAKVKFRLYAGDDFPMVAGLKGVSILSIRDFGEHFANDLKSSSFDAKYVLIEPSYDVFNDYKDGTSQHPLGNVTHGEALIKHTYEAIRNSPIWPKSMLIITWDEHGGFYDHADPGTPPQCVAPGDTGINAEFNQHGFTFDHYGPRVPAVVISPLVPKNLIDHRIYDHASIPATAMRVFNVPPLTKRDSFANGLNTLASLKVARTDAPKTLPSPPAEVMARVLTRQVIGATPVARPAAPVNEGSLPGILQSALHQDLQTSPPEQKPAIIARVQAIKTRTEAMEYMKSVQEKVHGQKAAAAVQ